MSQPAIRHAEDWVLPDNEKVDAVFEALTDSGAHDFSRELVQAIFESKKKNNLRPIQEIVDSWFRSLLFIRNGLTHDRLHELLDTIDAEPELTADEVVTRINA